MDRPGGTGVLLPLLLEIGTEEIPARFLSPAISDLSRIAREIFAEYRISFESVGVFATPRRIALVMEGVSPLQDRKSVV